MLGDLYNIYPLYVDLDDVGHSGASRHRVYVILALKTLRMIADPRQVYARVSATLRQTYTTRPRDYLNASVLEVQCEAMEASRASFAKLIRSHMFRPLSQRCALPNSRSVEALSFHEHALLNIGFEGPH